MTKGSVNSVAALLALATSAQAQAPEMPECLNPLTDARLAMTRAWEECLSEAADRFASQPEPATVVVDAVLATCDGYKVRIMTAWSSDLRCNEATARGFEAKLYKPRVLARVMAWRASHAKRKQDRM